MKVRPGPVSDSHFPLSPTDDGPYSKGGKDGTGADGALVCRRQSIPGTVDHTLP